MNSKFNFLGFIMFLCVIFLVFHMQNGSNKLDGDARDQRKRPSSAELHTEYTTGEHENVPLPSRRNEPVGLAPCGEVCSFGGQIVANITDIYPEWHKRVDCEDIMQRMSFRKHPIVYPPPEFPPEELVEEFTMYGKMPIDRYSYYKVSGSENKHNFTVGDIDDLIARLERDEDINKYNDGKCAQDTLAKYKEHIRDKRGVVIGTLKPWLEAILLAYGAAHVTTLEYADLRYDHPRIDAYNPYDFADRYLRGDVEKFDFGASFSSVEHAGLGRYTDPINPYGDLEAMAQAWCMTKPGGMFGLGVPGNVGRNIIVWNANRVYGDERLQHLTANWRVKERTHCGAHFFLAMFKVEY